MNTVTLKQKKSEIRKEESALLATEVLAFLVAYREEHLSHLTLTDLANELGFKHASSAMRMEKETFKLTLARFFELCDLYKLDPAKVIKEMQVSLQLKK